MPPRIDRIPFADNLLRRLAADLAADLPGAASGDLSAGLVLLPSSRACRTLQHELLAATGRDTLLLPRILTAAEWAEQAATALGLTVADLPDDRVRPIILTRSLATLPWLRDQRENAPGLAVEFIRFFDEARRHRRDALLLDRRQRDRVLEKATPAEAEIIAADLARIHEVWDLYRRLIPRDAIDRLTDLARVLAAVPVPGPAPDLAVVAGFGRLDPLGAELLQAALEGADGQRLYFPEAVDPLSRLFCATWSEGGRGTDPLAPARRTEALLTGDSIPAPDQPDPDPLGPRLAALREEQVPDREPVLAPCGDPEAESRRVVHQVVRILADPGGADRSLAVAVGDPRLAARITAGLLAAGIDVDNTHGQALSSLPAGLLVRFTLRSALTDLRPEPLLEVLTHPYVQLPVGEGTHGHWTLQLERMFRRNEGPAGGLAGLHRRAAERDETARQLFARQGPQMEAFVRTVTGALEPLLDLAGGAEHPWDELIAGVREAWAGLAPDHPLTAPGGRPDVTAVGRLLADLVGDTSLLPSATLTDFSAELGRLLAAENVPAHRARNLPVLVTGLVEARLESYDHLILAGLRDGVFPSRPTRPLLLSGSIRERLDLPGWRDALGRDAELFLRLLHNAPDVLLTWTTEEEGQPVLPSSFVSRLRLGLQLEPAPEPEDVRWRRERVPWPDLAAAADAFRNEDPEPGALAAVRPLTLLSWSALRQWRDCPYRFLLERGFALRKEEEVQEEFGRLEYGSLVHETLADFLAPAGPGFTALAAGDGDTAGAVLEAVARRRFAPGADDLPLRHLWLQSFLAGVPPLVDHELGRFADWRPVALEEPFALPLGDLAAWVVRQAAALDHDPGLPDLPGYAGDIVLRGTIDRIDRRLDDPRSLAVIDYKTGQAPGLKAVRELEEMQILLYAGAVEAGAAPVTGRVVEGFYYPVNEERPGRRGAAHLDGDHEEGRLLLVQGTARLIDLAVRAAAPEGRFPLVPRERKGEGPAGLPCTWCEFRGTCRLEERDLPPATARKLDKLVNSKDRF